MKNEAIKFTVVLPIYNVEKYLDRCMNSILNQSYTNLEIIMVDDGSPDRCPEICDEYAKIDSRIKVIHKKNAGLGMARNTGMENASGDYICFFDSDDFISKDLFRICAKELEQELYDVVAFDFMDFKNGCVVCYPKRSDKVIFRGSAVTEKLLKNMIYNRGNKERLHDCAWNKVYSLPFLKQIKFKYVSEREFISEDYYSNLILFHSVKSALVIPDALYYYCYNDSSLTRTFNPQRFDKILYQYNKSVQKCIELGYNEDIIKAVEFQTFSNVLGAMKSLLQQNQFSSKEKLQKLSDVICSDSYQKIFRALDTTSESLPVKHFIWALRHELVRLVALFIKFKYRT